jgi:hypothetical protein
MRHRVRNWLCHCPCYPECRASIQTLNRWSAPLFLLNPVKIPYNALDGGFYCEARGPKCHCEARGLKWLCGTQQEYIMRHGIHNWLCPLPLLAGHSNPGVYSNLESSLSTKVTGMGVST